jgi:hydrogenase-4 membrane subunit HyfE
MFTTGSKLLLGATVLSVAAAIVFGASNGGATGWLGTVALVSAAVVFALLFGVNYYTRDGNVSAMSQEAVAEAAAAQPPAGRSLWPLFAAMGVAAIAVGAVSKPIVLKAGVVVVLAAAVEWMVQAWSERASADPEYNAGLRKRILHPLEFPVLAAAGLAAMIYSFSRIMLWIDKSGGPVVFIIIGALVLFGGFVLASRPSLKKGVVAGVCTIGALGLVSTGAVMAVDGQRTIEAHPTTSTDNGAVCSQPEEGPGEQAEVDDKGSQAVAAKASVGLIVELKNGQLIAHEADIDQPQSTVTIARGNIVNLIFKNHDPEKRRLTVNMGEFEQDINGTVVKQRPKKCTTLVREDGSQLLTVEFSKPSAASAQPYSMTVPGVDGAEIKVVVP